MKKIPGIQSIIDSFRNIKVMVIGDVMTDAYLWGKAERLSPEAPVPVVHITKREMRPGGAANVAINLKALGAHPILCTVTGDDSAGAEFLTLLEKENIAATGVQRVKGRKTTVKTRVIGNNHQLLRVDDETIADLTGDEALEFISLCSKIIKTEMPGVIIFEDYDKGVLTPAVISEITREANAAGVPVAVDPKRKNFNTYRNISLFKPNLHELISGLNIVIDGVTAENLNKAVQPLFSERKIDLVLVTLSEQGVFIANAGSGIILPAHIRNISDVSGAGDTVISVAALCLAAGLPMETIAALSNLAGGLVCEQVGVVPIDREQLLKEASALPLLPEAQKS